MAVVPTTNRNTQSAGKRRRVWMLAVLAATASFFWLVTAVGDAAPGASAEGLSCELYEDLDGFIEPLRLEDPYVNEVPPFTIDPFFDFDDIDCRSTIPAPSDADGEPLLLDQDCADLVGPDFDSGLHPLPYRLPDPPVDPASGGLGGFPADIAPTCFNIVSQTLHQCAASTVWIVGAIINPTTTFGGAFRIAGIEDPVSMRSSTEDAALISGDDVTFSAPVTTFWGSYDPIPNELRPTTVEVDIYGQVVATFDIAPTEGSLIWPSGEEDSDCPGLNGAAGPEPQGPQANPCTADGGSLANCTPEWDWDCAGNVSVRIGIDDDGYVLNSGPAPESIVTKFSTGGVTTTASQSPSLTNTGWYFEDATTLDSGVWTVSTEVDFGSGFEPQIVATSSTDLRNDCSAAYTLDCPSLTVTHNVDPGDVRWPPQLRPNQSGEVGTIYLDVTDPIPSGTSLSPIAFDANGDATFMLPTASVQPSEGGQGWFGVEIFNSVPQSALVGSSLTPDDYVIDENGFVVVAEQQPIELGFADASTDDVVVWATSDRDYVCLAPTVDCANGNATLYIEASADRSSGAPLGNEELLTQQLIDVRVHVRSGPAADVSAFDPDNDGYDSWPLVWSLDALQSQLVGVNDTIVLPNVAGDQHDLRVTIGDGLVGAGIYDGQSWPPPDEAGFLPTAYPTDINGYEFPELPGSWMDIDCAAFADIECEAGDAIFGLGPPPGSLEIGAMPDSTSFYGPKTTADDPPLDGAFDALPSQNPGATVYYWIATAPRFPSELFDISRVAIYGDINEGLAPYVAGFTVPDCILDVSLECVDGAPLLRARVDDGAQTSIDRVGLTYGLVSTTFAPGSITVPNDDPGELTFALETAHGVLLNTGNGEPSANVSLPGIDCTLNATLICANSLAVLGMDQDRVSDSVISSFELQGTTLSFDPSASIGFNPTEPVIKVVITTDDGTEIVHELGQGDLVNGWNGSYVDVSLIESNAIFDPVAAGVADEEIPTNRRFALPDCELDTSIACVAGVPRIRANSDATASAPTGTLVTVSQGALTTGTVTPDDPNGLSVANDESGAASYALTVNNGVTLSPATLNALDCTVEIIHACVSGVPTFTITPPAHDSSGWLYIDGDQFLYEPDLGSSELLSADEYFGTEYYDVLVNLPGGNQDNILIPGSGQVTFSIDDPNPDAPPLGIEISPVPPSEEPSSASATRSITDCVIDVSISCVAGVAFVDTSDQVNTPASAIVTDNADGSVVVTSSSDDVYVNDEGVYPGAPSASVTLSRECTISVSWQLECRANEDGRQAPWAVVTARDFPNNSDQNLDFEIDPDQVDIADSIGTTVNGADLFPVDISQPIALLIPGEDVEIAEPANLGPDDFEFGADYSPISVSVPSCDVFASVSCAAGVITVSLSVDGAMPTAITVDGAPVALDADGTAEVTVGLLIEHVVVFEFADGLPQTFTHATPCTVIVGVDAVCINIDEVSVRVTPVGGTGTIDPTTITVAGDAELPFLIAPGSALTASDIVVMSDDTAPANISIEPFSIPETCDEEIPAASRAVLLKVSGVCVGGSVEVTVDVTGHPIGSITVNNGLPVRTSGASGVYLVAPGSTLIVAALGLPGDAFPVVSGLGQAPVCPDEQPIEPEPDTAPPAIAIPPAIQITFVPDPPDETPIEEPEPEEPQATTPELPEPTEEELPPAPEEPPPPDEPEEPAEPDEVLDEQTEPEPPSLTPTMIETAVSSNGGSLVALPQACDVPEIRIPGAVHLTRSGELVADDGTTEIVFTAEASTLRPGDYNQTISCGTTVVNIVLVVHGSPVGGQSGQRIISVLATVFAASGAAIGAGSRLIRFREDLV